MAPNKEPTRQQISSRLQYNANTPKFLQKLQNRIAGVADEDEEYDDEFEPDDGSGRPPIPRRPAIPERPDNDPGSADEDDGDEKPQVVVLREGKHLTAREAENVRRQERGLPPLPDPAESTSKSPPDSETKDKAPAKPKTATPSLSFSSTKNGFKAGAAKRKAALIGSKADGSAESHPKKKAKKESKTLLSFGDDA
ncbi:hypothetical protein C8F04DRAFT_253209 [Mycena alexandri]|uniref:DUF4604 domain-containing protein n=1 Tax=Mycena alexandri TaxID=1745969 RepID=A0AAD6T5X3_9AGAR|nr:hypothetical protein C8F04DRAFT_253209 [Mycena alexandri]